MSVTVFIIPLAGMSESALAVFPQNTAAVAGAVQVVLNCTSDLGSAQISWNFVETGALVVLRCEVFGSNP